MSSFFPGSVTEAISALAVNGDLSESEVLHANSKQTLPLNSESELFTTVKTMNSEMVTLGYPGVISIEIGQPKLMIDQLIQNSVRLLRAHFKNASIRDDLEYRIRSVEADLTHVRKAHSRSQDELVAARQANALGRERERKAEEEKKVLVARTKTLSDELRKAQLCFQRYETQSLHERRKLERELVTLRERLSTAISKQTAPISPSRRISLAPSALSSSTLSLNTLPSDVPDVGPSRPALPAARPIRRVAAMPIRTVASGHSKDSTSTRSSISREVKTLPDNSSAVAELYTDLIRKLEDKQHDLLYENRELRDLVSQVSSRLVRFTGFLDRHQIKHTSVRKSSDNLVSSEIEFDSLEEDGEEPALDHIRPNSSDEEPQYSVHAADRASLRRKSANVNELLLQLPYPLVRDHLIQRVRRLSRDLWRRLKTVALSSRPLLADRIDTSEISDRSHKQDLESEMTYPRSMTIDNTRSLTDGVDVESLRAEIIALKELVHNYESRLQEQQVALRHALFSTSRCSKPSLAESQSRSPDGSSQRRVSLFKIGQGPVWLGTSDLSLDGSSDVRLPTDGAGDVSDHENEPTYDRADFSASSVNIDLSAGPKPSEPTHIVAEQQAVHSGSDIPC